MRRTRMVSFRPKAVGLRGEISEPSSILQATQEKIQMTHNDFISNPLEFWMSLFPSATREKPRFSALAEAILRQPGGRSGCRSKSNPACLFNPPGNRFPAGRRWRSLRHPAPGILVRRNLPQRPAPKAEAQYLGRHQRNRGSLPGSRGNPHGHRRK